MLLHLLSGSFTTLRTIFGPWQLNVPFETVRDLIDTYNEEDDEDKASEMLDVLQTYSENLLFMSSEESRLRHNEKCGHINVDDQYDSLQEMGIISDAMWDALDDIFVEIFGKDSNSADMLGYCEMDDVSLSSPLDKYCLAVIKYLSEYAKTQLQNIDPAEYHDRHLRLVRAPTIAKLLLSEIPTLRRLPFPTNTMVNVMKDSLAEYGHGLMEVSSFSFLYLFHIVQKRISHPSRYVFSLVFLHPLSLSLSSLFAHHLIQLGRWVDPLCDFMVHFARATARNRVDDDDDLINPDSASAVITLFLRSSMEGTDEDIRLAIENVRLFPPLSLSFLIPSQYYLDLFNERRFGLCLLTCYAAASQSPRHIPSKHSDVASDLNEFAVNFDRHWKIWKGCHDRKVLDAARNAKDDGSNGPTIANMMFLTKWKCSATSKSDSRHCNNLRLWVAAELHPTVNEERLGWLQVRVLHQLRFDITQAIRHSHVAARGLLVDSKEYKALLNSPIEWWDRLVFDTSKPLLDVNIPNALKAYQGFIQWLEDNHTIQRFFSSLYTGWLCNNSDSASLKKRVLSVEIADELDRLAQVLSFFFFFSSSPSSSFLPGPSSRSRCSSSGEVPAKASHRSRRS